MVRAGAGAGKTYGLIHKIIDLVREFSTSNPGVLPRFVVTTFTRKATQEVRERLLSKALELRATEPEFGELFLRFLKSSGHLMVSTIHGVLNQFLRQHGSLVGLDPDFKISANHDIELNGLLHDLLLGEPTMPSIVKVFGWRRLRLFFLEHHRASILNPNISPIPKQHFIDYWNRRINYLFDAIDQILPQLELLMLKSKSETLRNFHHELLPFREIQKTHQDIWNRLDACKVQYRNLPKNLGSMSNWDESTKALRKIISTVLSELSEDRWTIRSDFELQFEYFEDLSHLGSVFSQRWLQQKISRSELEIEDLELLSLYILRTFPEQTKPFSESWNYWFIDEYQDTSPIQVEILSKLIGPCPHYIVGDPQQSIYFFRGARSKVFNEKLATLVQSGARIEEKTINRRSLTPTLHFINDLMDLINPLQFTPMLPMANKASDSLLVGHFYLIPSELEQHPFGIVKVLQNMIQKGIQPASIAILCRENNELRKLFLELKKFGLPAQVTSQGRFLEDREVRDALCFWKFLINPFDEVNLIELFRSPWFLIPDILLFRASQTKPLFLWHELSQIDHPVVETLKLALTRLQTAGHIETWEQGLIDCHAFDESAQVDFSGRKEGNLWKLVQQIQEQARSGKLDYTNPMNLSIQTDSNVENEAKAIRESDQIQLMTIHASKGLEFDHVILPFINHTRKKDGTDFWNIDLDNQNWSVPIIDSKTRSPYADFYAHSIAEQTHQLLTEESERLFYVAITRARKSLQFFVPQHLENISKTGWAKHFSDFIGRGPGLFSNKAGTYEFQVEDAAAAPEQPFASPSARDTVDQPPLFELNFSPTPESRSITSLLTPISYDGRESPDTRLNVSAIENGLQIHRRFEGYCLNQNSGNLTPELVNFLHYTEIPLVEIFDQGNPEWPFRIAVHGFVLEGQIDLWGRDNSRQLWIVDYKTGSTRFRDKAIQQMKYYAWALREMGLADKTEIVNLAVCYPSSNESFHFRLQTEEFDSIAQQIEQALKA
jgi:ATP-dependent helicase/nuclease subunit A